MEWTNTGKEHADTPQEREAVLDEIANLEWHDLTEGLQGPMSPVMALQEICKEIKGLHKRVAWNGVLFDRCGLLGLETHYRNGVCRSYWLDTGIGCTCLCHDYTETRGDSDGYL